MLATGGYEWNADLMADFDPIPGLQPLSPRSSTGDGLIMGAEIGAAIRRIQNNLSLMLGFYLVPDEPSHEPIQCMAGISEMCSPHTLVVNKAGQRFADESYFQSVVPALRKFDTLRHAYANLPCFLIFDQQFAKSYSLAHLPVGAAVPASVARADTIPVSPPSSASTPPVSIAPSSGSMALRQPADEDFQRGALRWRLADRSAEGRKNPSLGALDRPPFYGLELRPSLGTTSAGLLTNAHGPGLAPAPTSDCRLVCLRRGGGAKRDRRRISGGDQPRLGDDVQLPRREAHAAGLIYCTRRPMSLANRARPRSQPPWR